MRSFLFPEWTNTIRPVATVLVVGGIVYVIVLTAFGLSGKTTNPGYEPAQPVPFSHKLHAGELGMDCRYCHTTVEQTAFAALPPTQTCMNCHATIRTKSEKLQPIRDSYATGMPVPWVKVHDLPDYVYFDHSAHVRRGIGCVSCHGRVDEMEVVYQAEPLTMGWCLDCHRHPERALRPVDAVTRMDWVAPQGQAATGREIRKERGIAPPTECSSCHR
jgi:hypothetical protein